MIDPVIIIVGMMVWSDTGETLNYDILLLMIYSLLLLLFDDDVRSDRWRKVR